MQRRHFLFLMVALLPGSASAQNLVVDGNFDRPALQWGRGEQSGVWIVHGLKKDGSRVTIAPGEGRAGSRGARFEKTATVDENVHLDQIVPVEKQSIYELTAWVRCEGKLNPLLTVATVRWKQLVVLPTSAGPEWKQVRLAFATYDNDRVRIEWFPGSQGKLYQTEPGRSWLDDVRMSRMADPPKGLQQAFALARPQPQDEIDRAAMPVGAVGPVLPLRPIECRDGVLRYADGGEVALWGANIQTALSWEYEGRLKPSGVPREIEALKQITRDNLDQLARMGTTVVRAHLLPGDFTDRQGNLVDTIYLDALDYLLAECGRRGIYVYLTLINDMNVPPRIETFMTGHDRHQWLFDDAFVDCLDRYVRALTSHVNRYSGRTLAADPTIAAFEIMNEPGYLDYTAAQADRAARGDFDRWRAREKLEGYEASIYRAYRYQRIRTVIDRLAAGIRAANPRKPVFWNLNWPQMVVEHEDVFQATADSTIDGVSFCCYPGQADVPTPYWNHPMDLSGRNYLNYLLRCYREYSYLRWLLGKRFQSKAKVVYEFETFYNQSGYLYPAMARMFRGLGAQIAPMWQYTLTPAATYCGGSHYLNLYTTPSKAVSYRIAAWTFAHTPRFAEFSPEADNTELDLGDGRLSFAKNLSVVSNDEVFYHSGPVTDWPRPIATPRREIVGCGSSPLIEYAGSGAYFLAIGSDALELTILPDVSYPRPPWMKPGRWPWKEPTAVLDDKTAHPFTLRLPGWERDLIVRRVDGDKAQEVPLRSRNSFSATPGKYRIERARH